MDDMSARALREKTLKQVRLWSLMEKIKYHGQISSDPSADIRDRMSSWEKMMAYQKALKQLQGGKNKAKHTAHTNESADPGVGTDGKPIILRGDPVPGESNKGFPAALRASRPSGNLIIRPEIRWGWRSSIHGQAYLTDFLQNQVELFNTQPPAPPGLPGPEEWDKSVPWDPDYKTPPRTWGEYLLEEFNKNEQKPDFKDPEAWGDPSCIL
jgi:hypothetical protein